MAVRTQQQERADARQERADERRAGRFRLITESLRDRNTPYARDLTDSDACVLTELIRIGDALEDIREALDDAMSAPVSVRVAPCQRRDITPSPTPSEAAP